jgi:hypothetical protein
MRSQFNTRNSQGLWLGSLADPAEREDEGPGSGDAGWLLAAVLDGPRLHPAALSPAPSRHVQVLSKGLGSAETWRPALQVAQHDDTQHAACTRGCRITLTLRQTARPRVCVAWHS